MKKIIFSLFILTLFISCNTTEDLEKKLDDENFSFDDKNAVRRCLRENLLIEGSYSGRTIVALGL